MITKQTVLVLGAGASEPLGFPAAWKLRHLVIESTTHGNSANLVSMGFTAEEMVQFSRDLREASAASIDAFLERRNDPRYSELGKAAMAEYLIRCENPNNVSAVEREAQNMYRPLLAAMDCPFEKIRDNKLSVITFNYDRSLEHFLFRAFKAKYGRTQEECLGAISTIPIIHVHGQLGEYPAEEYSPDLGHRNLKECADHIKIPQDLSSYGPDIDGMLTAAERICFIGFGYHKLNLERLHLHEIAEGRREWRRRHPRIETPQQTIWGTSYNLPPKTDSMLRASWAMIDLRPQTGKDFLETVTLDE